MRATARAKSIRVTNDALIEQKKRQTKGDANFDEQVLESMFVFTYHLAESLATMPPPADIQQIIDRCN